MGAGRGWEAEMLHAGLPLSVDVHVSLGIDVQYFLAHVACKDKQ